MPVEKAAQQPLTFVDNAETPEIFADAIVGFHHLNGVVKIALGSVRMSHNGDGVANRVVVGRLVMSVPAALGLATGLTELLKRQGVGLPESAAKAKAN